MIIDALFNKVFAAYLMEDIAFDSSFLREIPVDGYKGIDLLETYRELQKMTNGDSVVRVSDLKLFRNPSRKVVGGKIESLDNGQLEDIVTEKTFEEYIRSLNGTGLYRFHELKTNPDDPTVIESGQLLDFIW